MIKLILFDIDDTLVDHQAGAFQAMQRISSLMIKLNYADDRYDFSEFIRSYETMSHTLWSQFELGEVDISTLLEKDLSIYMIGLVLKVLTSVLLKKNTGTHI